MFDFHDGVSSTFLHPGPISQYRECMVEYVR